MIGFDKDPFESSSQVPLLREISRSSLSENKTSETSPKEAQAPLQNF